MRAVIAEVPPRWLEERRRSGVDRYDEVWEGVLHVPPMPNRMHQRFARDLLIYLQTRWARPRGAEVHQEVNLTTPEDAAVDCTRNYRIPDMVLLPADRSGIDHGEYMAGPPLVAVEVFSPGDETYQKFPFYAAVGVPELWVFDRATREPEVYELAGGQYVLRSPGADGWLVSPAAGVAFLWDAANPGTVRARLNGDPATDEVLPN